MTKKAKTYTVNLRPRAFFYTRCYYTNDTNINVTDLHLLFLIRALFVSLALIHILVRSMNAIIQYLKDVRAEMAHVSWPTGRQTTVLTTLVIVVSILTALYLGFFDALFTRLLERII